MPVVSVEEAKNAAILGASCKKIFILGDHSGAELLQKSLEYFGRIATIKESYSYNLRRH